MKKINKYLHMSIFFVTLHRKLKYYGREFCHTAF